MTHMPTDGTVVVLEVDSNGQTLRDHEVDSGMNTANTGEANRAALQAALDYVSSLGGGTVRVRAGTYTVAKKTGSPWSIEMRSNTYLVGERGRTWIKHQAGMPGTSVSVIRCDQLANATIQDLGIDGNWGNSVGFIDDNIGINHTTQADPKNYGIDIKACTNMVVRNIDIRQTYGDGIHIGAGGISIPCNNVKVENVTIDMSARNGISLLEGSCHITIRNLDTTNIFTTAIDTEPVNSRNGPTDVVIDNCRLRKWWGAVHGQPLTIVGADNAAHDSSAARAYRVTNCLIEGQVLVSNAYDCVIDGCRIIADYTDVIGSPIYIDHVSEDVTVSNCYIYDRAGSQGDSHLAAVAVRHYVNVFRPTRVRLRNLTICAKNGRNGIAIDGCGGVLSANGTATGVTAMTLTDSGAAWATNQFSGSLVTMGGTTGVVNGNTATTLTIFGWFATPAGGLETATPSPGAYKIIGRRAGVEVVDCTVDCTDDGHGNGGVGLYLDAGDITAIPGNSQIKIRNLTVLNATTDAVQVQSRNAANPYRLIVLEGIHAMDDQPTPTCTTAVRFQGTANITKLLMRGITTDGVANIFAGVGAASPNVIKWLVKDGEAQEWEGFGAPAFTAAKGSRYYRKDGGASTTMYVNETGGSTWRAV